MNLEKHIQGALAMVVLDKFSPDISGIDDDALAWRYFDIPKFLYLITRQQLFFTRSNLLGDPFEGAPPEVVYEIVRRSSVGVVEALNARKASDDEIDSWAKDTFHDLRMKTYVNCWHLNEVESAAMWTIYGRAAGFAIKSRVNKLKRVVRKNMILGKVRYVDHKTAFFADDTNIYELFFLKRKSFAFENELRILKIDDPPPGSRDAPPGCDVDVDLNDLIDQIYISPQLPKWYTGVIEEILKKFKVEKLLIQSEMDAPPIV